MHYSGLPHWHRAIFKLPRCQRNSPEGLWITIMSTDMKHSANLVYISWDVMVTSSNGNFFTGWKCGVGVWGWVGLGVCGCGVLVGWGWGCWWGRVVGFTGHW